MDKSVVLLSSGLDSTVNLFLAHKITNVKLVITFDYGQRSLLREVEHSQKICSSLELPHQIIQLPWMKELSQSSLTNKNLSLPVGDEVLIDDFATSEKTAKSVWVANRNGLFINIASAYAETLDAKWVIPGFNKEEATTFPDNSMEFVQAINKSLYYSTANHVGVHSYTMNMNKTEIVSVALNERIPFTLMWPCYQNDSKWCGLCESCQRMKRALIANRVESDLLKELFV